MHPARPRSAHGVHQLGVFGSEGGFHLLEEPLLFL